MSGPLSRNVAQAIANAEAGVLSSFVLQAQETAASAISNLSRLSPRLPWSFDVFIPEVSAFATQAIAQSAEGCTRQAAAATRLARSAAAAASERFRRSVAASVSVVRERAKRSAEAGTPAEEDGANGASRQVPAAAWSEQAWQPGRGGRAAEGASAAEVLGSGGMRAPGAEAAAVGRVEAGGDSGHGGEGRRSKAVVTGGGQGIGWAGHGSEPASALAGGAVAQSAAAAAGWAGGEAVGWAAAQQGSAGSGASGSAGGGLNAASAGLPADGASVSVADAVANLQSPFRLPSAAQAGPAVTMTAAEAGYRHEIGAAQWQGTLADTPAFVMDLGALEGEAGGRGMAEPLPAEGQGQGLVAGEGGSEGAGSAATAAVAGRPASGGSAIQSRGAASATGAGHSSQQGLASAPASLPPPVRRLPLPSAALPPATSNVAGRAADSPSALAPPPCARLRAILAADEFGVPMGAAAAGAAAAAPLPPGSVAPDAPPLPAVLAPLLPPGAAADPEWRWLLQAAEAAARLRRLGLPRSSWRSKMPFLPPAARAPFLTRGLQWPEQALPAGASEAERRAFLRRSRQLQPFLFGRGEVPGAFWVAADALLVWLLVANPRWPWSLE